MKDFDVQFECCFNPHRQVIKIDGEGQSEIIFTADASQLAPILTSMAKFKGALVLCQLRKVGGQDEQRKGTKSSTKVIR